MEASTDQAASSFRAVRQIRLLAAPRIDVSSQIRWEPDFEAGTPGFNPGGIKVSEPGLYTLILRSRQATTPGTFAYRFRKWVTSEVLPTIRKTGSYNARPEAALPLNERLQMVRDAKASFGRLAAAHMWRDLGLPAGENLVSIVSTLPEEVVAPAAAKPTSGPFARSALDEGILQMALAAGPKGVRQDTILLHSQAPEKTTQKAIRRLYALQEIVVTHAPLDSPSANIVHASLYRG